MCFDEGTAFLGKKEDWVLSIEVWMVWYVRLRMAYGGGDVTGAGIGGMHHRMSYGDGIHIVQ